MKPLSEVNFFSTKITPMAGQMSLSTASGCVIYDRGRYGIASNWHVMSGRNTFTGQPLNKMLAIPDRLVVEQVTLVGNSICEFKHIIGLGNDEDPKWLQHPLGQDIDIAVVWLESVPPGTSAIDINKFTEAVPFPGTDVIFSGYPQGLNVQTLFPVWKSGMIATEPAMAVDNIQGLVLVDAQTMKGMSGCQVFLNTRGKYIVADGSTKLASGDGLYFFGIYSGRYQPEPKFQEEPENPVSFARVWHQNLLQEVVQKGVAGSYEIREK